MKLFFLVIIFAIFSSINGYSVSITDKLPLPSNDKYFTQLEVNLGLLKNDLRKIDSKKSKDKNSKKYNDLKVKLTGILKINGKFLAILNGNSYKVGDEISDYRIQNIDIKEVTLQNKKDRITLKIEK